MERGGSRTILELKEAATPGVDHGLDAKPMSKSSRLGSLKRDLWGVSTSTDYFYVEALGKTFLLRDRMAKASIDLADVRSKDLEKIIEAQASIIALVHKKTINVEPKAYARWLEDSSQTLADRWKKAYGN